MAIFKRAADVAKSNLEALRERLAGRELEDYTDEELLAELERRKLERRAREDEEARREARAETRETRRRAEPIARGRKKKGRAKAKATAKAPPDELTRAYASLELRRTSDLEAVKRQYRKLIRRYHPDRHAGDPRKQKIATELAQKLTKAYMKIRAHLEKK